jgi:curli biogenesis system outer membrane secretion channel CsgG
MNKKKLTEEARLALIRELTQTRNFCGNERRIMREWKQEYEISDEQEFEICMAVNEAWDSFTTKGYCAY